MIDCSRIYDKFFPVSFVEKKIKDQIVPFGYVFAHDHSKVIEPLIKVDEFDSCQKIIFGIIELLSEDKSLSNFLKTKTSDDDLENNFVFNFFNSLNYIVYREKELQVSDTNLYPYSDLSNFEFYEECLTTQLKRKQFVKKIGTFLKAYQAKKAPVTSGINPYRLNGNYRVEPSQNMQTKFQNFSLLIGTFITSSSSNITNLEKVFGGAPKFKRLEFNLGITCMKYFMVQLHKTIGIKDSIIKEPKLINSKFLTNCMVLVKSTKSSNTYTPISISQFRNNKYVQCTSKASYIDNAIASLK